MHQQSKKPLKRSILIGCVLFITILCLTLSLVSFAAYRNAMYARYEEYIRNILTYAASVIDTDDLAVCIRTGEKSEKYDALQDFLDRLRENIDVHFLYIVIPLNTNETDNLQNVIAAATRDEYEHHADELVELNALTGDAYDAEAAARYLRAYESGHLSFFEERSRWGDDYTGLLPLYDSAGEKVAALCMDVDVLDIHDTLLTHALITVLITVLLGAVLTVMFLVWIGANVTRPIELLEASVADFASRCHDQRDPEALTLDIPEIRTRNEVESLAHAVEKMGRDMRDYVDRVISTEQELQKASLLARKDALTSVGNPTAYRQYAAGLQERLARETLEFAVVMADVNELKLMNDRYGHEKGDVYLQSFCRVFCNAFKHSPVFRVGGDEFVAVLLGQDYEKREQLASLCRRRMRETQEDPNLQPWERVSAALGMASYEGGEQTVLDVFNRADRLMYQEKQIMQVSRR